MKRYLLLFVLAWSSLAVSAQPDSSERAAVPPPSELRNSDPERLWDRANTAYINNDFPQAISLYETILAGGRQSDKLYYNLGNAYFKERRLGRAILNYRRAQRLNPGNEDIRHNLQIAEKMTRDRIEAVPEFFVRNWLHDLRRSQSGTTWSILSLVLLALMLGCILAFLLSRCLGRRKAGFYGTVVSLLLFCLCLRFAAADRREAIDRASAVVQSASVVVKSSPDREATDLFILHEGTAVEISNRLDDWCEITIADGKKGWMPASKLEAI